MNFLLYMYILRLFGDAVNDINVKLYASFRFVIIKRLQYRYMVLQDYSTSILNRQTTFKILRLPRWDSTYNTVSGQTRNIQVDHLTDTLF